MDGERRERRGRQPRIMLMGVLALGLAAAAESWLADRRPDLEAVRGRAQFVVTSSLDAGPGSLREAIFGADRASERASIVVAVPTVVLETALPPLVNPRGVELKSAEGRSRIDARGLTGRVALDLRAPFSAVTGLAVEGAQGVAVRVAARGVELRDLVLAASGTGVEVAVGADGLTVTDSRFVANETGLRLDGEAGRVSILNCRFERQRWVGIWAARAEPQARLTGRYVTISGNRFVGDRIAVALANVLARVEDNDISGAREVGLYLAGRAAIVRNNRVREGAGIGVLAATAVGLEIAGNEIDHNAVAGALLKAGGSIAFQANRVHANGYGLITVFGDEARPHNLMGNVVYGQGHDGIVVLGGSPVMSGNKAIANSGAGLRVLDFVAADGDRRQARPLVEDLQLDQNGSDEVVRGVYREEEAG